MSILKLIASNSFLTVNKELAKAIGLDAAILFADLASASEYWKAKGETWFFRTRETIEQETTLSRKKQINANKILLEKGILKTKKMGLPAKAFYQIDKDCIENLLNLISKDRTTSRSKKEQQEIPKKDDINNNKGNNNKEKETREKARTETPKTSAMWTKLDTNLHNYKIPFSDTLNKELVKYWKYMEEKKGHNWGTKTTIVAQVDKVKAFLKNFSESQIIDSLEECQERGNVTYNPQWTINRRKKQQEENQSQNTYSFKTQISNA